jgi:ubiquinone/menaquinone biosynthesis C-methylase UbiE
MQKQFMYRSLAKYYDLLYSFKDYKQEAKILRRLIAKYKKSPGRDLLEVACGTGRHAAYLRDDFKILATDLNAAMLAEARKQTKGVAFREADMLTLNLGREFDVVLCLFSSIGYAKTPAKLRRTLRNFARHLKKGGVVIIEGWISRRDFKPGMTHLTARTKGDVKIARLFAARARGNISVLVAHYLIAGRDGKVRHLSDRHELGLFDEKMFLRAMEEAGPRAKFLKRGLMKGRGLYLGVKK